MNEEHARGGCGGEPYVCKSAEPGFQIMCMRCGCKTPWWKVEVFAWTTWDKAMGKFELHEAQLRIETLEWDLDHQG